VFSHFDCNRSNLFLRIDPTGKREIVAVDWGDCGIAALDGDLTRLVGSSTFFRDRDAARVAELDASAMRAYLAGLHEMGWRGDPNLVRLAYWNWCACVLDRG
jgi:Ser/Thr protein kinase RdoA (MazF antagonist)